MRYDSVRCNKITKSYRKVNVLEDVSFTLKKGHIYGLVGEDGAGKTTLMRIIMGLAFPTSGELQIFGDTLSRELRLNRKKIGSMIDTPIYNREITGRKNLELLYQLKDGKNKQGIDEVMKKMSLMQIANSRVKEYPFEMRQRLGIAGALLGQPELLILDEPFKGINPKGIEKISEILRSIYEQKEMTMLISSHNIEALSLVATDYIIFNKGKITEQFTREEILDQKIGGKRNV